jgi:arginyl-tRNA synthetase
MLKFKKSVKNPMLYINYLQEKSNQIKKIVYDLFQIDDIQENLVEFPEKEEFGDLTTNIAMLLSKRLKQSPRSIAEQIILKIKEKILEIEKIEIVGSGFINCFINKKQWLNIIKEILNQEKNYGKNNIGQNKKVNNEFCSANPTGPLHLGHVRGAIYGDVMARILKFSHYQVDNEYYINDLGGQIETLIQTVFLRYKELFGEKIILSEGLYPGEYLINVAKNLQKQFGNSLLSKSFGEIKNLLHKPVIDQMINIIKSDLEKLNIHFDIWTYESEITNSSLMNESLNILKAKNLIYRGILEKPKGEKDEDWESREQELFKSTEFGDDVDRAMKRSDGQWAYFAKDVAYHYDKIKRNYDWLILEVGIDHNGYKKRMIAAVNALSDSKQKFSFEYHNMVYLLSNGEQQKMSKRSGKLIGIDDILKEMNSGVLRFYMMSKRHDVELEFDIKKINEASKNNPYFYIQYGHARASSILRKAEQIEHNLSLQENEFNGIIEKMNINEIKLIKKLIMWPECIRIACEKLEPHRINFYLQDLASDFHNLWNLGNNDPALLFINKSDHLATKYRINIVKATKQTIANGLKLMGIEPLELM